MKKKNKITSGEQIKFKFPIDEADEFLEGVEDVFGPEDIKEDNPVTDLIYWARCCDCGDVISVCYKCHNPFQEGDFVYCIDTKGNHAQHYCGGCMIAWRLTYEGKRYLEKHSLK